MQYESPKVVLLGTFAELTGGPNGSFNDGGGLGAGMAGSFGTKGKSNGNL